MISVDEKPHSRCMLHKYLSHERDEDGINFVPGDFFEKNHITQVAGERVVKLDTENKQVVCDKGTVCSYDKLLIATGAESFIPPVGALRTAPNVFGLRHLSDAKACTEGSDYWFWSGGTGCSLRPSGTEKRNCDCRNGGENPSHSVGRNGSSPVSEAV